MLMHFGMLVVTPGQRPPILEDPSASYGATIVTGADGRHVPTDAEQGEAHARGERIAPVAP
ncbi:MAG: hypothetical protein ACR2M3_09770 [Thermomicrobiales bacterium]